MIRLKRNHRLTMFEFKQRGSGFDFGESRSYPPMPEPLDSSYSCCKKS